MRYGKDHWSWRGKDAHSKEYQAEASRKNRIKLKKIVFDFYGNRCNCCGESNRGFLTIDHINNDGYKTKSKGSTILYREIVKHSFPDTFQILCWNCNCGKAHNNGICPHEVTG